MLTSTHVCQIRSYFQRLSCILGALFDLYLISHLYLFSSEPQNVMLLTLTHELAVEKTDGSFQPSTLLESSRWYVCGKPLFYHGVKKKAGKQVCLEVQLQPLKTRMDSLAMFTLLYPLFSFNTLSHLYVSSTVQFSPLMVLLLPCNAMHTHLFRPDGLFFIQDFKYTDDPNAWRILALLPGEMQIKQQGNIPIHP